jgi:flagellar biosynthetic protein FliO
MRFTRRQWAVLAVVLAASAGAAAASAPGGLESRPVGGAGGGSPAGGNALWDWVRTILALALVVALIFAARWALRRWGGAAKSPRRSDVVEVLARESLSGRQQLYLVRLGERLLLLGGGGDRLATLAEVTDREEIDALLASLGRSRAPGPPAKPAGDAPAEARRAGGGRQEGGG